VGVEENRMRQSGRDGLWVFIHTFTVCLGVTLSPMTRVCRKLAFLLANVSSVCCGIGICT